VVNSELARRRTARRPTPSRGSAGGWRGDSVEALTSLLAFDGT
jgi:hypothetical protein